MVAPRRTRNQSFDAESTRQSSFLTVSLLWTVFDAFRLAGDGYRLVDGFLCVSSSMQPHYAIGISINVYVYPRCGRAHVNAGSASIALRIREVCAGRSNDWRRYSSDEQLSIA